MYLCLVAKDAVTGATERYTVVLVVGQVVIQALGGEIANGLLVYNFVAECIPAGIACFAQVALQPAGVDVQALVDCPTSLHVLPLVPPDFLFKVIVHLSQVLRLLLVVPEEHSV